MVKYDLIKKWFQAKCQQIVKEKNCKNAGRCLDLNLLQKSANCERKLREIVEKLFTLFAQFKFTEALKIFKFNEHKPAVYSFF